MKPTASLTDLVESLDLPTEEHDVYFDRETGRIVWIENDILEAAEDGDEEGLSDLRDWQKEDAELARAIVADEEKAERFISGPDKFVFHEYRQMEEFIETVTDASAADDLHRAIKGKGAFRYFKDTCSRLGLMDAWYKFRDEAMKRFVIEWAEENNVTYKDDIKRKTNPPAKQGQPRAQG